MTLSDAMQTRLAAAFEPYFRERDGAARQCMWTCEDGWYVVYTTTRIEGGPMHGKFAALAYKPEGKGARTGKASQWVCVYKRAFATRKGAKARAVKLYYDHSPKANKRHHPYEEKEGRWVT